MCVPNEVVVVLVVVVDVGEALVLVADVDVVGHVVPTLYTSKTPQLLGCVACEVKGQIPIFWSHSHRSPIESKARFAQLFNVQREG